MSDARDKILRYYKGTEGESTAVKLGNVTLHPLETARTLSQ